MSKIEAIDAEIKELNAQLENVEGTETEVYARIVGYYRSVRNWNKGKKSEYVMRKDFSSEVVIPENNTPEERAARVLEDCDSACGCANDTPMEAPIKDGYLYFYRTTCPNCPPVKKYLSTLGVQVFEINVDTPEGFDIASNLGVMATPTAIYLDKDGNEGFRGSDVPSLKKAV